MSKLRVSVCCGDYDRTRFLIDGTVQAEGLDLSVVTLASGERHDRFVRNMEFDVCELQMGIFLGWMARGAPYTAIPVFPNRGFCHGNLVVRNSLDIESASDLNGKVLGIPANFNPVAVWIRGLLHDEFGVDLTSLKLRSRAREQVPGWEPPPWMDLERLPRDMDMDDALTTGLIDGYVAPTVSMKPNRDGLPVRRLWANYREVEADYFRRTGIFPLRHVVVIKNELLEAQPWVAMSVFKAFEAAKRRGIAYMMDERRSFLAWYGAEIDEEIELFGPDLWPSGVENNRVAIETMTRYAAECGVADHVLSMEEMFAESTLRTHLDNQSD